MEGGGKRKGPAVLRFFGMESREKALDTLKWELPYLAVLAAVLAGASYVARRFLGLSLGACAGGAALSLLYFFLFLARARRAAVGTGEVDGGRPEG